MSNDLAQRVATRAAAPSNSNGQQKNGSSGTLKEFVRDMTPQIARALPAHVSPERIARIALTELRTVKHLAECTKESFGGALMTCAQLGLEPGKATGEAYLIPFFNKHRRAYEVSLIIGYAGMVKLFYQHPLAAGLDAQTVYESDEFEYQLGLDPVLRHKPMMTGNRGRPIAYYAVARLKGGGSAFTVMSPADIEANRQRSKAKDDGPWQTDYDEMAKKTCIRRLAKLLPKSTELSQALLQDEGVRTSLELDAVDEAPLYPDAIPGEVVSESGGPS